MGVVALYKKIELTTKRAVTLAFSDISQAQLFKIKALKDALKKKGVNLEALPSYPVMDEIRCINNDIKHSGVVGKELSAYDGWTEGQPLVNLDAAYNRLAPLASSYINELIDALIVPSAATRV